METKTVTFPWSFPGTNEIEAFVIKKFKVFALRVPNTHQVLLIDYDMKETMDLSIHQKSIPNYRKYVEKALIEYSRSEYRSSNFDEYIRECSLLTKTFNLKVEFVGDRSTIKFTPVLINTRKILEDELIQKNNLLLIEFNNKCLQNALNDKGCCICMDGPEDTVLSPCGHKTFCYSCIDDYRQTKNTCPICNSLISLHTRVFG